MKTASQVTLALLFAVLGSSCTTPAPPTPARAPPGPAPSPATTPPPLSDARQLPHPTIPNVDYYPQEARRRELTGRVLVELRISANGSAIDMRVVQAEADPILQQGAMRLAGAARFDVSDPKYDAADPRPFYLPVVFCLEKCGDLKPYPGYGKNEVIVTGSRLARSTPCPGVGRCPP